MSRSAFMLLFACGVAATLAFQVVKAFQTGPPSVRRVSFTLIQREVSMESAERHKLIAVRADGAKAEQIVPGGNVFDGWEARAVTFPAQRMHLVIADKVKMLSTFYFSGDAAHLASHSTYSADCAKETNPKARMTDKVNILGVQAYHYQIPSAREEVIEEQWLVPILGCIPIQAAYRETRGAGSADRVFSRTPISLVLQEPDPALFEVPLDYAEVPPSAAQKQIIAQKRGKAFGEMPSDAGLVRGFDKQDQKYWASRAYQP